MQGRPKYLLTESLILVFQTNAQALPFNSQKMQANTKGPIRINT
jgi:hypothetical protein